MRIDIAHNTSHAKTPQHQHAITGLAGDGRLSSQPPNHLPGSRNAWQLLEMSGR
jgi:hypothetical protein